MLSQCPHCQKDLNLNEAQQEKVQKALDALAEGKTLKIGCPFCKQAINLRRDGSAAEGGVMNNVLYAEHTGAEDKPVERMVEEAKKAPQPVKAPPAAPKPPDVGWLATGDYKAQEVVKNVPLVMLLMADTPARASVAEAFSALGYQPEFPESAEQAMERMRFVNFAAVVLHSAFEGGTLKESAFHRHMCEMPMASRRTIYYALLGPEFHTLYDLEALSFSANLVVNDREVAQMPTILKKGLRDYQDLFGPFLETLEAHGKKQ
ncbi:MAG: hypothetical protein ACOY8P_09085 [Thermodesulfobacteriota bacterium]